MTESVNLFRLKIEPSLLRYDKFHRKEATFNVVNKAAAFPREAVILDNAHNQATIAVRLSSENSAFVLCYFRNPFSIRKRVSWLKGASA